MFKFKYTLLLCIIFLLGSCKSLEISTDGSYEVDLTQKNEYVNSEKIELSVATTTYGELICLELDSDKPVCLKVNRILYTKIDSTNEPYILVNIYKPSRYGELTITDTEALSKEINQ